MFSNDIAIGYVYNSNRLDGVALTEDQTRQVIEGVVDRSVKSELDAPDGKSWDIAVVSSHRDALERVAEIAKTDEPVSEETILALHKTLMGEVLLAAGEYRECILKYKGMLPSPPDTIKPRMEALIKLANAGLAKAEKKDQLAWRIHHEFITIHPFIEANGRMARLLMNLLRLRAGLTLLSVKFDDREKYSKAIVEFQQHKAARPSSEGKITG